MNGFRPHDPVADAAPSAVSGFRQHAIEWAAIAFGVLAVAVAFYGFDQAKSQFHTLPGESTQTETARAVNAGATDLFAAVIALSGILLGGGAIAFGFYRIVHAGFEQRVKGEISHVSATVRAEAERKTPVKLVGTSDEIWSTSIDMLRRISVETHHDRHAYDVTSYMNQVRYEEAVCWVLSSEVPFRRVFCFKVRDQAPSDLAVSWFFDSIVKGGSNDLGQIADFQRELALAFKETHRDPTPAELDEQHVRRLQTIVNEQHEAFTRGLLQVVSIEHRMQSDFVAINYASAAPEDSRMYEVMANFKTTPGSETYVVGTYGSGALARGYVDLFNNLFSGDTYV